MEVRELREVNESIKVRTISALGDGITSRTKAKQFIREGRAKWTDLTRTAIIFDDQDYRHECALKSQETAAERRLRHRTVFQISSWPPARTITGIPHQALNPQGFCSYPIRDEISMRRRTGLFGPGGGFGMRALDGRAA